MRAGRQSCVCGTWTTCHEQKWHFHYIRSKCEENWLSFRGHLTWGDIFSLPKMTFSLRNVKEEKNDNLYSHFGWLKKKKKKAAAGEDIMCCTVVDQAEKVWKLLFWKCNMWSGLQRLDKITGTPFNTTRDILWCWVEIGLIRAGIANEVWIIHPLPL